MKFSPIKFLFQALLVAAIFVAGALAGSLAMGTQCYNWNWGQIIIDAFDSEPMQESTESTQTISPVDAALTQWPVFTVSPYEMNCCTIGESLYVQVNFPLGIEGFTFSVQVTSNGLSIGDIYFVESTNAQFGWTAINVPIVTEPGETIDVIVTVEHPILGTTVLDTVTFNNHH